MHKLIILDKMPQLLKTKNQANNVVFDSVLISGVDYDEEEFDDDKYDNK